MISLQTTESSKKEDNIQECFINHERPQKARKIVSGVLHKPWETTEAMKIVSECLHKPWENTLKQGR